MQKMENYRNSKSNEISNQEKETQILNLICNTSILLMSVMTEAFTEVFTQLSREMITTIITQSNTSEDSIKKINEETDKFNSKLPAQIMKELGAMKTDITVQLRERKEKLASIITDKKFEEGIAIVERYQFSLPKLTNDLDERSLLRYVTLLQENNESFTTMFQELVAWMKDLPQPK